MTNTGMSFLGGILIGMAALLLLLSNGKIAGISGLMGNLLNSPFSSNGWTLSFLAGLTLGGVFAHVFGWIDVAPLPNRSFGSFIAGGLLVGWGTQLGSGCTSGHGVCGIGRFSLRSIVATAVFIIMGAVTVWIMSRPGFLS